MKIVIAIDSFKGSMSSMEAGYAAKEGILKASGGGSMGTPGDIDFSTSSGICRDTGFSTSSGTCRNTVIPKNTGTCTAENLKSVLPEIVVKPLADGGEGTTEALVEGLGGTMQEVAVTGPMGEKTIARYGILKDGRTAVLEMAEAAGITLVDRKALDPWKASTVGVGEMILDAIGHGCRDFIVGIGGSATTEGGIGMLTALGYEFLDERGQILPPQFASLAKVHRICKDRVPQVLQECRFRVACDVTNPLCGENGSIYVYGPQKGVKSEERADMDRMMTHYAQVAMGFCNRKCSDYPGAGAAGGLGFAFLNFIHHAELMSGIQIVLDAIGLEEEVKNADIVITGEGRLDSQTANGKVPVGVAKLAKKYGAKVLAFAGGVTDDARVCNEAGIDAFFPILRGVSTLEEAMEPERAKKNMILAVEQVFRLL